MIAFSIPCWTGCGLLWTQDVCGFDGLCKYELLVTYQQGLQKPALCNVSAMRSGWIFLSFLSTCSLYSLIPFFRFPAISSSLLHCPVGWFQNLLAVWLWNRLTIPLFMHIAILDLLSLCLFTSHWGWNHIFYLKTPDSNTHKQVVSSVSESSKLIHKLTKQIAQSSLRQLRSFFGCADVS